MRVFTCAFGTETNTFAPFPTGRDAFEGEFYFPPGAHPDEIQEFTVPLVLARRRGAAKGWIVQEGTCAFAAPGGPTTRCTYERFRDRLLGELEAALPVDIIALGLHGAMVAEGYSDCEGDLLTRMRRLAGAGTVIGAELDPHGHLSQAVVDNADALVFMKEYPHTDFRERGEELMDILEAAALREVRPTSSVHACGMIAAYHTTIEPMKSYVNRMREFERAPDVLSVSLVHSFPWADIPDMGTKVLVVTDDDREAGDRIAATLAQELYALRGRTRSPVVPMEEAIERAAAATRWPVIMADIADNPGAGCGGDSTYLLRAFLDHGLRDTAFAPIYDPGCVSIAFAAGEGARLKMRIGGKMSKHSGQPVDAAVRVIRLEENLKLDFAGTVIPVGRAAAVSMDSAGVELVLLERRHQALETGIFDKMGISARARKRLVIKSSQHFHASFAPIAAEILYVDSPGAAATDVTRLNYEHIRRPMWPFDKEVTDT